MALFITGDLHCPHGFARLEKFTSHFGNELSKRDVLITLGDMCLPWNNPPTKIEQQMLQKINNMPFKLILIDGNHDNHTIIQQTPTIKAFGSTAYQISENLLCLKRGHKYTICGHTILAMGGAKSVDYKNTLQNDTISPYEIPNTKQRKKCDKTIDKQNDFELILTHTPPTSALLNHAKNIEINWTPDEYNDWLENHIVKKANFDMWFYGHMHDDRPWEMPYIPLMNVIYDLDNQFPNQLWGPNSQLDEWEPDQPF